MNRRQLLARTAALVAAVPFAQKIIEAAPQLPILRKAVAYLPATEEVLADARPIQVAIRDQLGMLVDPEFITIEASAPTGRRYSSGTTRLSPGIYEAHLPPGDWTVRSHARSGAVHSRFVIVPEMRA